jgi:6-phosphogluconolactonase
MQKYELSFFQDDEGLAHGVAAEWLKVLEETKRSGEKPFITALSGGRIARRFFAEAAKLGKSNRRWFDRVQFFWGDERCVPPGDPESNFGIAKELLFMPLNIGEGQIHRIRGEERPEAAAAQAERELRGVAAAEQSGLPVFDLIFLGMGEDGHVASLFPEETESARMNPAVYRPVRATKPPPDRITLGYGTIAVAKQVWVMVSGAGKEKALRASVKSGGLTPLGRVLEMRERTRIFSDVIV